MKTGPWIILCGLIAIITLSGCSGGSTGGSKGTSEEKLYDIKGKVLALMPEKSELKLDHEDIPGLMPAMKMDFKVADPKLLQGLQVGDSVQGKLKKDSSAGYLLTKLEKQ